MKDFIIKTVFIVSLILMMSDGKYFPYLNLVFQFLIGKVKITCPGHIASPKYSFNSS